MINSRLIDYTKQFIKSSIDIEEGLYNVCTDTRTFTSGSIFIAITGDKFNAVDHLSVLKDKNCPIIIYEKNHSNELKINNLRSSFKTNFVAVKSCIKFIQELANLQVKEFKKNNGVVVSISGSNGKTTTKEMLTHLLNSKFPNEVISTQKNYNNHLGVPYTIFNLLPESKFLVLEFGSNSPGEINALIKISEPDFSIVTNIGETHLEFFENAVEGVFIEESSTYSWIKESGKKFFLNYDDEFLNTLEVTDKIITYGFSEEAQLRFFEMDNGIKINDLVEIKNPNIMGQFNFINLALSAIVAKEISGLEFSDFSEGISTFKPSLLRSEWVEMFDTKFFLDAYNANPSSMKHSIAAFKDYAQKHNLRDEDILFIVGDMNELGNYTGSAHRELSSMLTDNNSIFIGRYSRYFTDTHGHYETVDAFINDYPKPNFKNFKLIFIKASRSLQLERILGITY